MHTNIRLLYFSNFHELGHWIAAKKMYSEYEEMCIGNFFFFNITKKIKISPIIITGYVSVSQEVILNGAIVNALFYLGGGVLANTMLLVLGLITQNFCSILREIVFINAIQIITSIIPFEGSDGRNILRVVRYKMKYDSC